MFEYVEIMFKASKHVAFNSHKVMLVLFSTGAVRKRHFSMASQLCHHYVLSCKYWWDFLQFVSHPQCQDELCQ